MICADAVKVRIVLLNGGRILIECGREDGMVGILIRHGFKER